MRHDLGPGLKADSRIPGLDLGAELRLDPLAEGGEPVLDAAQPQHPAAAALTPATHVSSANYNILVYDWVIWNIGHKYFRGLLIMQIMHLYTIQTLSCFAVLIKNLI